MLLELEQLVTSGTVILRTFYGTDLLLCLQVLSEMPGKKNKPLRNRIKDYRRVAVM